MLPVGNLFTTARYEEGFHAGLCVPRARKRFSECFHGRSSKTRKSGPLKPSAQRPPASAGKYL
eukprot:562906-Lingulodinium_polyedra.AAC.1